MPLEAEGDKDEEGGGAGADEERAPPKKRWVLGLFLVKRRGAARVSGATGMDQCMRMGLWSSVNAVNAASSCLCHICRHLRTEAAPLPA
jgi:hypothetical protein